MTEHKQWQVWVNTELCSGGGACVEALPEVFGLDEDGFAHVIYDRPMSFSTEGIPIPDGLLRQVIEVAENCPGEVIFVERRKD